MRPTAPILLITAAGLLAGCDWSKGVAGKVVPDTASLADRCADIMKRAMPFADVETGDETSKGVDIRTIVAHVEGKRTDLSGNAELTRDLAVECTFTDNVLSAFRWTKGGPPAP